MLTVFLLLFILLSVIYPEKVKNYPYFVDWKTIITLAGLLIISTGIKESGYFYHVPRKILIKLKSERVLALFLIFLSALLSTFLTNDVCLFIVIPLTITLQKILKNDIVKMIIFEAIAVNVGSLLTPIGNPQNLFLWHEWDISFVSFIIKMFPLFILLLFILTIFILPIFSDKKLKFSGDESRNDIKKDIFMISFLFLIACLLALQLKLAPYLLPAIFAIYLVLNKKMLLKVDWAMLFLFVIIFIDFHLISEIGLISNFVNSIDLSNSRNVFLFSLTASQIMSNVPASIFLSKFSSNWLAIAYGVNVGGNGIIIASLANVIALRMIKDRKILFTFHKYSLAYLLISAVMTYLAFFL